MRFTTIVFVLLSVFPAGISAQVTDFQFPAGQLEKLNNMAVSRIKNDQTAIVNRESLYQEISGFQQLEACRKQLSALKIHIPLPGNGQPSSDTLYVTDTMVITGNWIHSGTIIIAYSGLLHFKNANATILGDIFLLGENPRLTADSSTLYIPQAYFYQRVVFAAGGGRITYRNSTVDHSSLSHNIILVDSARLELLNVTNKGFTTNGIYDKSEVFVDGTNEAGEYVILDESNLNFRNAETVLLWHHFPEGASVNFTFPEGDTTLAYRFNNTLPGISGVNYDISVDNCYNVMWGMMPENDTEITISESQIRAIGLWFMGSDTVNVSGLVDNSYYTDFNAPLSDRNMRLINSKVTTWSIYPMEHSFVNLADCIVGEVGTGGHSTLSGQQYFCDGSGGYVWASDSSLMISGFSFVSGYVRSQANGMLIYAYSSLASGFPSALQNSMMMVLQCTLPEEPRALDKSVVWYAYIDQPFEAEAGALVPITGSAWIEKSAVSTWMEFGHYSLFYQEAESQEWIEIGVDSLFEKHNEVLGYWNTSGLAAGQYLLKLVIVDNWGNSAEAMKGIMLQPTFGLENPKSNSLNAYPNPAKDRIILELPEVSNQATVYISDAMGRVQMIQEFRGSRIELLLGKLKPGLYFVRVANGKEFSLARVMIK
ncbi:MAG: T9SS type A sorting domain-containing protein [Bacteroidales bacterium]|nr:T9SS type A sorting domain-containing protein [Bacteroidales bacterium]